jgi:hypothetical protein
MEMIHLSGKRGYDRANPQSLRQLERAPAAAPSANTGALSIFLYILRAMPIAGIKA